MNERTLKALVENGAIKKVRIIGSGSKFHIELVAASESYIAKTNKGSIKQWVTLDAAAKWVKNLGIGRAELMLDRWDYKQKVLSLR
jgi:hypothetical protein